MRLALLPGTARFVTITAQLPAPTAAQPAAASSGVTPPPGAMEPRPFVKWAGGKTQLLAELIPRIPVQIQRYFEPFAGGAAVFFALATRQADRQPPAVLNDLGDELITAFEVVRDAPEALIDRLSTLQHAYVDADEDARAALYYEVREQRPDAPLEVAARFIFLNKTCFNGLYRVNRRSEFNVPHGRYRRPRIVDAPALTAASRALAGVELRHSDFVDACSGATAGDFVYLDPPFFPLSATSSFTAYTGTSFSQQDQLRLKRLIDELTTRGVFVMLSNSPHQWIEGLYEGSSFFVEYRVERLPARRSINSRGDRRGVIDELLVTNYTLDGDGVAHVRPAVAPDSH